MSPRAFTQILCEAILKEVKCLDKPQDHNIIDVWFLMLIYTNGGSLQKSAEKIMKKKIIDGCFRETLFDQCIHGHRELVQVSSCWVFLCTEHLNINGDETLLKFRISKPFDLYMHSGLLPLISLCL